MTRVQAEIQLASTRIHTTLNLPSLQTLTTEPKPCHSCVFDVCVGGRGEGRGGEGREGGEEREGEKEGGEQEGGDMEGLCARTPSVDLVKLRMCVTIVFVLLNLPFRHQHVSFTRHFVANPATNFHLPGFLLVPNFPPTDPATPGGTRSRYPHILRHVRARCCGRCSQQLVDLAKTSFSSSYASLNVGASRR